MLAAIEASPPAPISPARLRPWTKIGLVAVLAGGGGLSAHHLMRTREAPSGSPAVTRTSSPDVGAPAKMAVAPEVRPVIEPHAAELAPAQGNNTRARRAVPVRVRETPAHMAEPAVDDSLGEETKLLDRTREALDAHRTPEAMGLLDDYHRRFPKGRLRPEATILRLAGLVQGGNRQGAEALGEKLVADELFRPYLPKIERLLEDARR
jgi:hypothetical protein